MLQLRKSFSSSSQRCSFASDGSMESESEELSFVVVYYINLLHIWDSNPLIKVTLHKNFRFLDQLLARTVLWRREKQVE